MAFRSIGIQMHRALVPLRLVQGLPKEVVELPRVDLMMFSSDFPPKGDHPKKQDFLGFWHLRTETKKWLLEDHFITSTIRPSTRLRLPVNQSASQQTKSETHVFKDCFNEGQKKKKKKNFMSNSPHPKFRWICPSTSRLLSCYIWIYLRLLWRVTASKAAYLAKSVKWSGESNLAAVKMAPVYLNLGLGSADFGWICCFFFGVIMMCDSHKGFYGNLVDPNLPL